MIDEISAEDRTWLLARAEQTRQRWRDASEAISKHSNPIREQLEELRSIDGHLPFALLTILLEQELQRT